MGIELTDRVKNILEPLNEKEKEAVLKIAWYMCHDEAYLDDYFRKGCSSNSLMSMYDGCHVEERRRMENYFVVRAIAKIEQY